MQKCILILVSFGSSGHNYLCWITDGDSRQKMISEILSFDHLKLQEVITQLNPTLIRYIKFKTLNPFLREYQIFTQSEMKHFSNEYHDVEDKVSNLIEWLNQKHEKGIYDFVKALNDAFEHSGHLVILEEIYKKLTIKQTA